MRSMRHAFTAKNKLLKFWLGFGLILFPIIVSPSIIARLMIRAKQNTYVVGTFKTFSKTKVVTRRSRVGYEVFLGEINGAPFEMSLRSAGKQLKPGDIEPVLYVPDGPTRFF